MLHYVVSPVRGYQLLPVSDEDDLVAPTNNNNNKNSRDDEITPSRFASAGRFSALESMRLIGCMYVYACNDFEYDLAGI